MSKKTVQKRSLGKLLKKSFGLSIKKSFFISKFLGFNSRLDLNKKLNGKKIYFIKKRIKRFFFGSNLKNSIRLSILSLIHIKSYKGIRHKSKQPARGQRTHTNGKTKKKFRY